MLFAAYNLPHPNMLSLHVSSGKMTLYFIIQR